MCNLESGSELQKLIRVCTVTSISALHQQLHTLLSGFRSPWGALLLLFSLLLSRGLVSRDILVPCGILYMKCLGVHNCQIMLWLEMI